MHFLTRRRFAAKHGVQRARITLTADDYYKLYVNGHFVGQGPAPAFPDRYWVNQWDVGRFLIRGENAIAIHVYYQGLANNAWVSGDLRMGVIARLDMEDANGRASAIVTDDAWRYDVCRAWPSGPQIATVGYDTQVLEPIDSRLFDPGWREPQFDDRAWRVPDVVDIAKKDYTFFPQPSPGLQMYTVAPERVEAVGDDTYRLDFGREITGQFGMEIPGKDGHVVEIRHAEELNPDGSIRFNMRCNCNYREQWTLSGRATETLEFFDYKGFRYVEVRNPTVRLDTRNTWATVRHYPYPAKPDAFHSSDERLNAIWNLCANGVRLCCQEIYVDCPTREKGQYFGDTLVTAAAHLYLTGDNRLSRKAIEDMAWTAQVCPGLLSTAPCLVLHEFVDYCLQFPLHLERDFMWTGDKAFLRRMLPVARGMLAYYRQFENQDGLLGHTDKWNLVDWPRNLRDDYDYRLDGKAEERDSHPYTVLNAWYIGAMETVSRLSGFAGEEGMDSSRQRKAFESAFRIPGSGLFRDAVGSRHRSLHANAVPLFFGLVGSADRGRVTDHLRKKRLSCGVYMAYFLLKALAAQGEHALVYDLLTCDDPNSWNAMLRAGATACLEVWDPDQKPNTSFCHAWASTPIVMIVEQVMGLKPLSPGWETALFDPHTPSQLERASLDVALPTGPVRVSFARERGRIDYSLEFPAGQRWKLPLGNGWTIMEKREGFLRLRASTPCSGAPR